MIKKTHRLPLGDARVSGKKTHTPFITLVVAPPQTNHSRLGIIVGTRVSKKAAQRNRLKRQIAAIMRSVLKKPPHHDYLIITKPKAAHINFQALKASLKQALSSLAP